MDNLKLEDFIGSIRVILISILVLGIVLYAILMLLYVFDIRPGSVILKSASPSYMFALPICAIAAFGIVSVLDVLTSQVGTGQNGQLGSLAFKAFGLEFNGPAGPVTLWIVVYLTLVCSIRIIGESPRISGQPSSAPPSAAAANRAPVGSSAPEADSKPAGAST